MNKKMIRIYHPLIIDLLNIGSGFTQPICLNPDSIDSFVMDPASFDGTGNSNSIW
jgi:hypothetical protein